MERKTKRMILILLLVLLLVPYPFRAHDGGTVVYQAILYRVIVWHRYDDTKPGGFKTGTEFYIFPTNFREID